MLSTNHQIIAQQLYGNRIRVRVCGVCIENGQILLVCHRPILGKNDYWCPPGGGVDEGETRQIKTIEDYLWLVDLSKEEV